MADTLRTVADMLANLFQDGQAAGISANDIRDLLISCFGVYANTQTGGGNSPPSYTAVLTDEGLCVEMNNASAVSFVVPTNASVAFRVGAVIEVCQLGAGTVTIAAANSGVTTLRSATGTYTTRAQYASARLRKRATDEWVLSGDLT